MFDKKMYIKVLLLFFSMLLSDFASAAVMISFGVVIGKTSPLQLIVMALIEIVLFTINEVIGRKYLKVRISFHTFPYRLSRVKYLLKSYF